MASTIERQKELACRTVPCNGDPRTCACVIDISNDESLARDFHRWLNCSSPQDRDKTKRQLCEEGTTSRTTAVQDSKPDGRRIKKTGVTLNTYGRRYLPGRPLDLDDRQLIIDCHLRGMKVNFIARQLCISHGCVSKIIARYRLTGLLAAACAAESRRRNRQRLLMLEVAAALERKREEEDAASVSTDESIDTQSSQYSPFEDTFEGYS